MLTKKNKAEWKQIREEIRLFMPNEDIRKGIILSYCDLIAECDTIEEVRRLFLEDKRQFDKIRNLQSLIEGDRSRDLL